MYQMRGNEKRFMIDMLVNKKRKSKDKEGLTKDNQKVLLD